MKGLIYGGLSALLLTTATTASIAAPVPKLQAETVQPDASMVFNFSAPIITNSGVRGSTHFIRVAVIGMSLQDLMISIPSQMDRFDKVRIINEAGKEVAAKTNVSKERLSITFDQPVAPGGYLQVEFTGVQMATLASSGDILLYGVTARRVGLTGDIPVGTARIQLPLRS